MTARRAATQHRRLPVNGSLGPLVLETMFPVPRNKPTSWTVRYTARSDQLACCVDHCRIRPGQHLRLARAHKSTKLVSCHPNCHPNTKTHTRGISRNLISICFHFTLVVPGGGIEPPTRGFSIHCSTPELPGHGETSLSRVEAF